MIEALGLQDATNKFTPAEGTPLVRDTDGEAFPETFNYASVIGMLLYLAGHSRPILPMLLIALLVTCSLLELYMKRPSSGLAGISRLLKTVVSSYVHRIMF